MPDFPDSSEHVKPFIHETLSTKALHFSISEIQSRMRIQTPYALDLEYTRTMMAFLLFNPEPKALAMIGLGGGSMTKFCHRFLPRTRIKVVEINPHVIALREEFCVPRDDDRFAVRLGDGAAFVRAPSLRPDVLLVDGFDADGQPPTLCSQSFYDDCRDALAPDGLMVVNLHTAHPDFPVQVAGITRAFGDDVLLVEDRDGSNTVVFACKCPMQEQFKPCARSRLKAFDRQSWEDLIPALQHVSNALKAQLELR